MTGAITDSVWKGRARKTLFKNLSRTNSKLRSGKLAMDGLEPYIKTIGILLANILIILQSLLFVILVTIILLSFIALIFLIVYIHFFNLW